MPKKQKKLLKHALLYHEFELKQRASKEFTATDWLSLTAESFEEFRMSKVPLLIRGGSAVSSGSASTSSVSATGVTAVQVNAFDAGQRRDVKSYVKFDGTPKLYFRT